MPLTADPHNSILAECDTHYQSVSKVKVFFLVLREYHVINLYGTWS